MHAFFRPDGLPVICFPMRGHRWRLTLPFVGDRSGRAPTLAEIQRLTDQRAPRPVTVSDPTWLAWTAENATEPPGQLRIGARLSAILVPLAALSSLRYGPTDGQPAVNLYIAGLEVNSSHEVNGPHGCRRQDQVDR